MFSCTYYVAHCGEVNADDSEERGHIEKEEQEEEEEDGEDGETIQGRVGGRGKRGRIRGQWGESEVEIIAREEKSRGEKKKIKRKEGQIEEVENEAVE